MTKEEYYKRNRLNRIANKTINLSIKMCSMDIGESLSAIFEYCKYVNNFRYGIKHNNRKIDI